MNTAQNHTRAPRRPGALLGALIGAVALLGLLAPASALAAPALEVSTQHQPPNVPADSHAQYAVEVSNPGDAATSASPITIDVTIPPGLRITSISDEVALLTGGFFPIWSCSIAGDRQSASCAGVDSSGARGGPLPISAGNEACVDVLDLSCRLLVNVKTDPGLPLGTVLTPTVTVCGGGVTVCPAVAATAPPDPIEIGDPIEFGLSGFDGEMLKQNGDPETQAGARPYSASTGFTLNMVVTPNGEGYSAEGLRDAIVRIPPGLVGNPEAFATCSEAGISAGLIGGGGGGANCPPESQVGTVSILLGGLFGSPSNLRPGVYPVYNLERPPGTPGALGFHAFGNVTHVFARVRSGDDYGLTLSAENAPEGLPLGGVDFELWGVPADASHDARRRGPGCTSGCASSAQPPQAFVTLPTSCVGPVESFIDVTSWQTGASDSASFLSHDNGGVPIGNEGCPSVPFAPTVEARPTTTAGDSPSGLDVDLRIPQSDDPNGLATAHLKDTTVTLPEGLVLNPGGANGLDGCSPAEFGYTSTDPDGTIHTTPAGATCPDASKVATVKVTTPLLEEPLEGAAYVADPFANPFDSLLALYITVDDEATGIVVKLAGEVSLDPNTGQVSSTFNQNPQLPFENFELNFFGGAGGALRTPAICGNHTTEARLTPWSSTGGGLPVDVTDTWAIAQNCSGSAAEQPHAPSFDAGAVSPIAGTHSPFVVKLRREDGSQQFSAVTVRPPLGLTAKLAGTPACSDGALAAAAAKSGVGEKASPSCPAASEVGNVTAGAGAGPAPYYAHGKVYLAGPYKGAPISLATVIPATAGPFDLGTVVTRIAAHINPATAEITAVSDQIPSILQGIPLDVKTVDVALDKPQFSLNPTNCDPMAVTGQLLSTIGALANLESRFQLGECTSLGFKPKMALRLKGGTARGKHPQLSAYLLPRAGDANIRSVSVAFPRSEFLENAHIRTICTRPDFAADNCPAGAVYGSSTVFTPLLDYPLTGNVYLRSSNNLLPDVVPDLRGPAHQPIKVEAAGRVDSVRGGIRSTFDFFPDAPFTRAVLRMQGGNKGLLVNSRNICARTYRALVKFTAHNGARHTLRPKLVAKSCKKKKRRKAKRGGHGRKGKGGKRVALAARSSVR